LSLRNRTLFVVGLLYHWITYVVALGTRRKLRSGVQWDWNDELAPRGMSLARRAA